MDGLCCFKGGGGGRGGKHLAHFIQPLLRSHEGILSMLFGNLKALHLILLAPISQGLEALQLKTLEPGLENIWDVIACVFDDRSIGSAWQRVGPGKQPQNSEWSP